MNSVAFYFNGIFLLNNYVTKNASIKAIEFYTNSPINTDFRLYVIFIFKFYYFSFDIKKLI